MSRAAKNPADTLASAIDRAKRDQTYVVVPIGDKTPTTRSIRGAAKAWSNRETADWLYDIVNHLVGYKEDIESALEFLKANGKPYEPPEVLSRADVNSVEYDNLVNQYKGAKHQNADLDQLISFIRLRTTNEHGKSGVTYESAKGKKKGRAPESRKKGGQPSALNSYKNGLPDKNGKVAHWDVTNVTDDSGTGARVSYLSTPVKLRSGKSVVDRLVYTNVSQLRHAAAYLHLDADALVHKADSQKLQHDREEASSHARAPVPIDARAPNVKSPQFNAASVTIPTTVRVK